MSHTLSLPTRSWARLHRTAIVVMALGIALAAVLGVVVADLLTRSAPAVTTSVSGDLQPVDDGCQVARPGEPC